MGGLVGGMNGGTGKGSWATCECVIFLYNGLQIWMGRVEEAGHSAKMGLDSLTVGYPVWTGSYGPRTSRKAARSVSGDEICGRATPGGQLPETKGRVVVPGGGGVQVGGM